MNRTKNNLSWQQNLSDNYRQRVQYRIQRFFFFVKMIKNSFTDFFIIIHCQFKLSSIQQLTLLTSFCGFTNFLILTNNSTTYSNKVFFF